MKLADSNVWLAMTISTHDYYPAAQNWLSRQSNPGEVLFCRATQQSLLRLLTTRGVFASHAIPPLTNTEAWNLYHGLVSDVRTSFVAEPVGLETYWQKFATRELSSPKVWMDAYLAAFAVAGNYEFVTTDKGFRQYAGLKLELLTII